jgi:hypothetical protein
MQVPLFTVLFQEFAKPCNQVLLLAAAHCKPARITMHSPSSVKGSKPGQKERRWSSWIVDSVHRYANLSVGGFASAF